MARHPGESSDHPLDAREARRHPHEVHGEEEDGPAVRFVPSILARRTSQEHEQQKLHQQALARDRRRSTASAGSADLPRPGTQQRKEADAKMQHLGTPPDKAFVDSHGFTQFFAGLVVINVCTIGLATDYNHLAPGAFDVVNTGFLLLYFTETFLRLMTHGLRALQDRLTVLDLVLNALAFGEALISEERSYARALPALRLLRVSRFLRASKFFRTQRELWLLSATFSNALAALGWVALFLGLLLLSCAILAHSVVGESSHWVEKNDPLADVEPFDAFNNHEYFGSVARSLLSLFQIVTLSEWSDHMARQVILVYPVSFLFFFFFIFATAYGMVMCIVSNVVLSSIISAKGLSMARLEMDREIRESVAGEALQIFSLGDSNGDGTLTEEELEVQLSKPALPKVLTSLDVPVLDAHSLVLMFDHDGDGVVNYEELVRGIARMNEEILPKDFTKLNIRGLALLKRAQQLHARMDELFAMLARAREMMEVSQRALQNLMYTREREADRNKALEFLKSLPVLPLPPEEPEEMVIARAKATAGFLGFAKNFCGYQGAPEPAPSSAEDTVVGLGPDDDRLRRAAGAAAPPPLRAAGSAALPPDRPALLAGPQPLPDPSAMMAKICGKAVLTGPPPSRYDVGLPKRIADAKRDEARRGKWDQLDLRAGRVHAVDEMRRVLR